MDLIDKLTECLGFYPSYTGTFGEQVIADKQSKEKLLSAMGYQLDDDSLFNSIQQLEEKQWLQILPATHIAQVENEHHSIVISLPQNCQHIVNWKIVTESNGVLTGSTDINHLDVIAEHHVNHQQYSQYQLPLPKLEEGYYQFNIYFDEIEANCALICAPKHCYSHHEASQHKVWGYTAQLYSIRSKKNWGIGDFNDLLLLNQQASQQGASLIGLNPLHALFKSNPAHRSPYSPSSRSFLNPIYIDVTSIENYMSCNAVQTIINSDSFKQRLAHLASSDLVDYTGVAENKYEIIELLFEDFLNNCSSSENALSSHYTHMTTEFEDFKREYGEDLYQFSTFDAFYEHFHSLDSNCYGWNDWPEAYHDPCSNEVKLLQEKLTQRIDFFSFLQWIAHKQLLAAAKQAKKEMAIGLYLDLAVGCDGSGADVWSNQGVYVTGASIGAPPDNLNALGQSWGLTPINPVSLKEQGYQPLIKALRNIMQYAGAIRIDHILGLMRQYWVAPYMDATKGLYIHYPFDDILRIIALESRRNKCIVIGEDLGNVPEGFSEKINNVGLLSFKVLFFERWHNGLFKRPENFPEKSISTVSTHDTPTLTGWWEGIDLQWRQKLNLYPNDEAGELERNARAGERVNLIAALDDWQVIDMTNAPVQSPPTMNTELSTSVQKYLASSPSHIQLISLEDALENKEQVNIPGTIDEHPNWLQKLPVLLEEIPQVSSVEKISKTMRQVRPKS